MAKKYLNCVKVPRSSGDVWRARLTFPFDKELGYKPSAKDFYGKTAAEADKKRSEWKPEKNNVDRETTLLQFVEKTFLPEQEALAKAGQLSWSYFERRRMILRRFFLDPVDKRLKESPLRRIALGDLRPQHMESYFACVSHCQISQEYHHRLKSDFRAALRMAKHKIPESVVDYFKDIEVPSLPSRKNLLMLFDPQEVYNKIIDESLPVEDRAIIAMPFILNRRPSEVFALQWDAIDLDTGTVHIHKRMERISAGSFRLSDGTKTGDKGIRVLPLSAELLDLLRRLKETSQSDFVFLTKKDKVPYNVQNFRKNWPVIKKNLGLPNGPSYYSLKHLGNSYALANGVTPEAQAWKMGHADTTMAMKTYREIMGQEKVRTVSVYSQLAPAPRELTSGEIRR